MININLLPSEVKTKVTKLKHSASIYGICLVVVIVFVLSAVLLTIYKNDLLQNQLNSYGNDITQNTKELANFSDLQSKALFLNDRVKLATSIENTRSNWSVIMQDLINSVPSNVQFISLNANLSKSPNFVLQGSTATERDAIKFKDKLESSTYFKNVSFKSSSASTSETESKLTFSLEFNSEKASADKGTK